MLTKTCPQCKEQKLYNAFNNLGQGVCKACHIINRIEEGKKRKIATRAYDKKRNESFRSKRHDRPMPKKKINVEPDWWDKFLASHNVVGR